MTCDDYQIAIEQLAAGAHAAIPTTEVDDHVAGCAACTAYASLSRKVSASMSTTLAASPPPLDLDAMRVRIHQFRRQASRARWLWPMIFGPLLLVMYRVVLGWPSTLAHAIVSVALATVLSAVAIAIFMRRQIVGLKALEAKSGADLVAGMRAELDRRIRTEREGWWVLPIVLAAFHARFVGWALPSGGLLVFELCFLAVFPLGIVRYRRAKRERALLA